MFFVGELAEEFLGAGREFSGHFDMDLHNQVADPPAADLGHAHASHLDRSVALRALGDLQRLCTFERGHIHGRPECCLAVGDRHLTDQVAAMPREKRMFLDLDHAVAVAWGATVASRLAFPCQPNPHVLIDAGGDRHLAFDMLFHQPSTAAGGALVANEFPSTAAGRACRLHAKHACRLQHLAMASAVVAVLRACAWLGPRALARATGLMPDKADRASCPLGRFRQRQRQLAENIFALAGPGPPTPATAAESLAENTTTEQLSECIEDVGHVVEVVGATPKPGMTVAVVAIPQRGIRKHLKGPCRLFKADRSLVVPRIAIRMKLHSELAIGRGDFAGRSPPFHAQHFVVVPLLRHGVRSLQALLRGRLLESCNSEPLPLEAFKQGGRPADSRHGLLLCFLSQRPPPRSRGARPHNSDQRTLPSTRCFFRSSFSRFVTRA